METIAESLAKVWFLGVAVVGIAAYAVTLKVRVDYLEKNYDKQITALWEKVNQFTAEKLNEKTN